MSVFSPVESTSVASRGNTPCTRRRRNNLGPALLLLAEAPEIKGRRPGRRRSPPSALVSGSGGHGILKEQRQNLSYFYNRQPKSSLRGI